MPLARRELRSICLLALLKVFCLRVALVLLGSTVTWHIDGLLVACIAFILLSDGSA